ncbi:MAG: TetR/AcrR family transcriptional regulator [Bacillota bacterium]
MKNNPKKSLIIRAAQKRFARHGLNKTTIEEIARDLRIGKASIYNYFASKEEIFQEVLGLEIDKFISEIQEIFYSAETELKDKLLGYLALKENIKDKYILIYNLVIGTFMEFMPETESQLLKSMLKNEEDVINKFLKSYAKRDLLPNLPSFLINFTWGLVLTNQFDIIQEKYLPSKNSEILEIFLKDYLV